MLFDACLQYSVLALFECLLMFYFKAYTNMDGNPRKKTLYICLAFSVLAIMTMFRGPSIGNDTEEYIEMFYRIADSNPINYISNSITEPGFILYCWFLSRLSNSPQILFIVTGIIVYCSIGRYLVRFVPAPGIVCYSMITLMKFDFFISAERQALAIALVMMSYGAYERKQLIKTIPFTLVAITIHYSSLIYLLAFLVYYFVQIDRIKLNRTFYSIWLFVVIIVMVLFNQVLRLVLRVFPKYSYYQGTALFDGNPRLAIVLQVLVAICLYYFTSLLLTNDEKLNIRNKTLSYLAFANITIAIVASNATALNRLCDTFTLFPVSQYSMVLVGSRIRYKNNLQIVLASTIVLFYLYGLVIVALKTPEWYTTYPFSFAT